ncbi:MAG: helix-turn-helix domain-containing protein [Candidatus Moranbacteria bacterium]|nr:helix-turn-helix domain-containing protein [Candidatus Moranbacteria bacterium]
MNDKGFNRAKIDSLTLGERLAKLRENQELTVEELAKKIKIKPLYIKSFESGNYQFLPTKVYARGFISAYARHFNVSEKKLFKLFDREYRIYKNIHKKDESPVEDITRLPALPKIILTSKTIIFLAVTSVIILASLYLFFGFQQFVSSPWLRIEEPASETMTKEQTVIIKGTTKNDARVFINDQLVQVDLSGNFNDQVGLLPGLNKITIKSINQFDKESVEIITVDAQYSEVAPTDYSESNVENKISLKIKATEKTILVKIVADNILIYNDALKIDEEKEFFAEEKIEVSSNDGKNTLINFNDSEEFSSLSDKNKAVENIVFEKEKVLDKSKAVEIEDDESDE